jgi:hypothetical protein
VKKKMALMKTSEQKPFREGNEEEKIRDAVNN